jgi:ATP-dependent Clp protease, protease subunit
MKTAGSEFISEIHDYQLNLSTREIYLHSHLDMDADNDPGVEYRMAVTFVKNIHILEAQSPKSILVHMHTEGGEWGDGMAIFNSVRFCRCPITMLAYAQASSMGGVALQAADRRVLMPDCELMIHHGSITVDENTVAAKSHIDQNERFCKRMLQVFGERAVNGRYFKDRKYSLRRTMNFIDSKIRQTGDWFLTAEEAVYYGFADGVVGQKGFESLGKIRVGRKWI